uniref:Uncharacterized protein n=1 Tax=Arundo donax TaxID=35708 RepID=A0A0A9QI03_ARUDO
MSFSSRHITVFLTSSSFSISFPVAAIMCSFSFTDFLMHSTSARVYLQAFSLSEYRFLM